MLGLHVASQGGDVENFNMSSNRSKPLVVRII